MKLKNCSLLFRTKLACANALSLVAPSVVLTIHIHWFYLPVHMIEYLWSCLRDFCLPQVVSSSVSPPPLGCQPGVPGGCQFRLSRCLWFVLSGAPQEPNLYFFSRAQLVCGVLLLKGSACVWSTSSHGLSLCVEYSSRTCYVLHTCQSSQRLIVVEQA